MKMTWFWSLIVVWSSPHESVLFYGSSHWSVFESPVHWVHNEHNSKSPVTKFGSYGRVQNVVTCNETHIEEGKSIHTPNTFIHVPIQARHTCIHPQVHPHTYTYIHVYTSIYIHTYIYIYISKHINTYYIYTHIPMHTSMHKYMHT